MKLCKDCRWAKPAEGLLLELRRYDYDCMHSSSQYVGPPDYVLGRTPEPQQMSCVDARGDPRHCGPDARYWEQIGFGH